MEEWIIYITAFLTGVMFGSFFTLAVYRIPRKENILYGRSHCTSCNHRLGFWDLIPILSYLFLGGKCRYCGEKIRIRYLLLEIFSGSVFLLVALTHGTSNLVLLCFYYLFFAAMFIIAGIDKERLEIPNGLYLYGLCVALAHFAYAVWKGQAYGEYILGVVIIPVILYIVIKLLTLLKKQGVKFAFGNGDIKFLAIIGLMFGFPLQVVSILFSLVIALVGLLFHKDKEIPWGFYFTIATVGLVIFEPYMTTFIT